MLTAHRASSVLLARTGRAGVVAHRPDPDHPAAPACPATTTGHWHTMAAERAERLLASPCREAACFPRGWPS